MPTGFLMYHELERPGRALAEEGPSYARYAVGEPRFAAELAWIASAGLRGVGVAQARAAGLDTPGQVVITFDDGCETDWIAAAPRLRESGFGATFYVVSGWIGRRAGFMTAGQLRELAGAGFEVGSHSATHAFLSDLGDGDLRRELVDSRRAIEDVIGRAVTQLSCPGGRWTRRVARAAREAGYETMATSRIGANGTASNPYTLARCAVTREMPQDTFEAFCRGTGLAVMQVRDRALAAAKAVLGNRAYAALRGAALRRPSTPGVR